MLTVKQTAAVLGVSGQTVYGLCKHRRIRHERHGLGRGKIFIPEDAIAEYRRGVTVGVGEAASVPPPAPKVKLKHLRL
jgi:excisionase family DNA binding protein